MTDAALFAFARDALVIDLRGAARATHTHGGLVARPVSVLVIDCTEPPTEKSARARPFRPSRRRGAFKATCRLTSSALDAENEPRHGNHER